MTQETETALPAGMHRGVLAGLSEEERKRLVDEDVARLVQEIRDREELREARFLDAKDASVPRKPMFSFREALNKKTKEQIMADAFPVTDDMSDEAKDVIAKLGECPKSQVIDVLLSSVTKSWGAIERELASATADQLQGVKTLLEREEPLVFTDDEVRDGALSGMYPLDGVTTLYHYKGEFTFVLLEEQRQRLGNVNFRAAEKLSQDFAKARDIVSTLTELCGVVEVNDAFKQYTDWTLEDGLDFESFRAAVDAELVFSDRMYGDWSYQGRSYYIHYTIDHDIDQPGLKEDVQGYLEYLVKCHESIGRTNLPNEYAEDDVMDRLYGCPAGINLRNYLDAHVPDGQDDLNFAERMVEQVYDLLQSKAPMTDIFEAFEEEGMVVEGEIASQLDMLVGLYRDQLPSWENNGLSVVQRQTGMTSPRVFYTEDGQKIKVGRNDPCPCGSGLKYKKCCGR